MYCSKCGSQMPDGARFCHNCGAALQGGGESSQSASQPQPFYPPEKQRPKWLVPVVAGGSVLALLIVIVVIAQVVIRSVIGGGEAPSAPAQEESAITTPAPELSFERYENDRVMFAIDYPADFEFSEPNINNVVFGSGEQCRVAVEYTFMTPGNSFIYSAEDFISQASEDEGLVSDWVGAGGVKVTGAEDRKLGGKACTAIIWELAQNGKDYDGALYVLDSQGDFGCYTVLTMLERGSEQEEYFQESMDAMLKSFEITGAYEAEGYTIIHSEELGLRFAVQEDRINGRIDMEDDHVMIIPEGDTFSHSSIRIEQETIYEPAEDTVERVLNGCSKYYLEYKDNGRFISEPSLLDLGRYDFSEVDIQYSESGEHVASIVVFTYADSYWEITMLASEENLEATRQVLGDVLTSICFEGTPSHSVGKTDEPSGSDTSKPSGADTDYNEVIDGILTKIESTSGFMGPDSSYEPLASFTDIDGNGVYELLVLYKVKVKGSGGNDIFRAKYDVYSVEGGSYTAITTGTELYDEVGGNGGSIGLVVDKAMKPYLKVETKFPQGDRFNDSILYLPWNDDQSDFDNYTVYLERHGVYGEEDKGQYIIGATEVDQAKYEARQTEFMSLWTDLNLGMGPGNGGNNMSFEQIRTLDMNTYTFNSVG